MDEESSRPLIRQAVEAGISSLTEPMCRSTGRTEEIVGRARSDFGNREGLVIASKVQGRVHEGPNGTVLSRKAIMVEVQPSRSRRGMDPAWTSSRYTAGIH
jgi:1-deoxyxylulose-5-phosphate synthase